MIIADTGDHGVYRGEVDFSITLENQESVSLKRPKIDAIAHPNPFMDRFHPRHSSVQISIWSRVALFIPYGLESGFRHGMQVLVFRILGVRHGQGSAQSYSFNTNV